MSPSEIFFKNTLESVDSDMAAYILIATTHRRRSRGKMGEGLQPPESGKAIFRQSLNFNVLNELFNQIINRFKHGFI